MFLKHPFPINDAGWSAIIVAILTGAPNNDLCVYPKSKELSTTVGKILFLILKYLIFIRLYSISKGSNSPVAEAFVTSEIGWSLSIPLIFFSLCKSHVSTVPNTALPDRIASFSFLLFWIIRLSLGVTCGVEKRNAALDLASYSPLLHEIHYKNIVKPEPTQLFELVAPCYPM